METKSINIYGIFFIKFLNKNLPELAAKEEYKNIPIFAKDSYNDSSFFEDFVECFYDDLERIIEALGGIYEYDYSMENGITSENGVYVVDFDMPIIKEVNDLYGKYFSMDFEELRGFKSLYDLAYDHIDNAVRHCFDDYVECYNIEKNSQIVGTRIEIHSGISYRSECFFIFCLYSFVKALESCVEYANKFLIH